jgi:putative endonuclease
MKRGYVYMLASGRNGTLYVGTTSNLPKRIQQHRDGVVDGFTKRYSVHRLVHVETFDDIRDAIARERQLKKWNREWKLDLIEEHNPDWEDVSDRL